MKITGFFHRVSGWLLLVAALVMIVACGGSSNHGIPPTITSLRTTVFTETVAGTFTVTATGNPAPTLALTGALPTGVTFNASTGVLSGTPAAASSGAYPLAITATNGVSPDATMVFALVVVTKSTTALIVHDGTAGIEADVVANLTAKLTTAGLTVTANVGIPASDLSTYGQIWDVRFNTTTPLTAADIADYSVYLASGRTLVVIGENTGFATRNDSIVSLISYLGGGTLTLTSPANAQTVLAPFTGPTALSTITFLAGAGTANPGSGALITKDASNIGSALYYARGTLTNALDGRLITVFDINFLQASADANSQTLIGNIIALP